LGDLPSFIRTRRERADPKALGLDPELGKNRTSLPGLRQPEMARLMGITEQWYRALESGRAPWQRDHAEEFARILQLPTADRFVLFKLALGLEQQEVKASAGVAEADRATVEAFSIPAMLLDHMFNIRALNEYMEVLLPELRLGDNYLAWTLASLVARVRLVDWFAAWAVPTADWLRTIYSLAPDHLKTDLDVVVDVVRLVPEVAALWESGHGYQAWPTNQLRQVKADDAHGEGQSGEVTVRLWTGTPDASPGWKLLTMAPISAPAVRSRRRGR
jgi:hypothetical protein